MKMEGVALGHGRLCAKAACLLRAYSVEKVARHILRRLLKGALTLAVIEIGASGAI